MKYRNWFLTIFLIFALLAILFFYFYEAERERKINEIVSHQKIHAKQAARSFFELIDKWNSVLYYLSKDKSVARMDEEGQNELEGLFRVLKDEIAGITRADKNGRITFTIPYSAKSIGADISKQKHMVKILADHKPVISDVFQAVQGFQAIVIHYPIFINGNYDGSIAFLLNFESIAKEILEEIRIGNSARSWMISSEGIELYCVNKTHIGKSAFETAGSSLDAQGLARLMMKGEEGVTSLQFDDKEVGRFNAVVYYLPIKLNNTFWSLAILSSEDELGAPLYNFSLKLITVFSILFWLGVFLSYYTFRAWGIVKESKARIKAEGELRISEERHRLISSVTSDYIFTTRIDKTGKLAHDWISGAFSSMTGYSLEEYKQIGGWRAALYPEDYAEDDAAMELLYQNKHAISEVRTISKNGKILWVRVFAQPIWDEKANKLIGIYGAVKDITDSKNAENALRESEKRFRTIYNSVSDAIFIHDINTGAILDVNSTMEKMFELTRDEALKIEVGKISLGITPYTQKEAAEWMMKAKHVGPQTFEWMAKTSRGKVFWVEVSMARVNIAGDDRLLVSVRNISERKHFEDQLQILREAVEQSPASIVITDSEGIIEYVNDGFRRISGYSTDELVGKTLRILNNKKETEIDTEEIWKSLYAGKEWRSEHLNKRKDDSAYWESTLISSVKDSDGKILHLLAVQEDITERKNIERQLKEAKDKAEIMNRVKSNFLSNMSHELRTPLVGMLGISEQLSHELEGKKQELIMMLNKSSLRLLDTLNTLLNYSKIDSEQVETSLATVKVIEFVREEIKLFEAFAGKHGLYIKEDFKCDEFAAKTDKDLLKTIIDNLLSNAIRFTVEGGVIVSLEKSKTEFKISIQDTGIGIPDDKLSIIFQEFRQVSEGKGRNFEGTGLGLTIVKKYVDALNGSITVESEIDKGSKFIVTIPLNEIIQSNSITRNGTDVNKKNHSGEETLRKFNVLLVEDDEINSFAISQMLTEICEITEASNAIDAFKQAESGEYDIILMDINLRKGKSGVEATQEIRMIEKYMYTPIVALTAYAMSEDRTEFLNEGFTHYLSKPFSRDQLVELINQIISVKE
ncbi:MAG: PAS domain S-box protein [Melioribacteraceae bacterium]